MAAAPVGPVLSWMRLVRLPNVFTAIADVSMAYWIPRSGDAPLFTVSLAMIAASSAMLYAAGMASNDLFDLDEDRRDRPFRPLPSGAISPFAASVLTAALFAGALLASAAASTRSLVFASALAAAILLYNRVHKRIDALAPAGMGMCRTLNVLLGASAASQAGDHETVGAVALANGVYVAGITLFARSEASRSPRKRLALGLAVMAAGLAIHAATLLVLRANSPFAWILLLGTAALVGRFAMLARESQVPADVQRTVKTAILGLIAIDAAMAFAFAGGPAGATVFVLLLPSVVLGRRVYST